MSASVWGLLIPFLGTAAGSACVFFLRRSLSDALRRSLTGFAAGVMTAASVWSLIVPAIEQASGMGRWAFLPAFIGFWCGILFLLLLDRLIPHLHAGAEQAEGPKSRLKRTTMMVLAVTLHNIPEGMAVGIVYAGVRSGSALITAGGALSLALGIAIQNFPEGAIISLPLCAEGKSKAASFGLGVLSGAVEPVFGRGGGHALCGGGGADPGDERRGTFQYRHGVLRRGFQHHDGPGRRPGMIKEYE